MKRIGRRLDSLVASAFAPAVLVLLPQLALAQAASPFLTGANSLQTNILAWLTPVAIILIMVLAHIYGLPLRCKRRLRLWIQDRTATNISGL